MNATNRPNILWITSDQQHWMTLGCLNPEIRTPNLDRLAARGLLMERCYCPNPTCTPTRASMITGQLPSQHGAYSLGTKLPETAVTIGDCLAEAGYATALIGKAHFQQLLSTPKFPSIESYPLLRDLDYWREFDGPFYGFRHVELARPHADEAHVGQHYALWMEEKGFAEWKRHYQNKWGDYDFTEGGPVNPPQRHRWTLPEACHPNRWIEERSIAVMEKARAAGQPFFCWASYFDPHPPYLVPEPWASMYDPSQVTVPQAAPGEHDRNPPHFKLTQEPKPDFSRWRADPQGNAVHGFNSHLRDRDELARDIAVYYGMISFMDDSIGKLLDYLDQSGLAENTLVAFTSDHGHFYGQHGLVAKGAFHYDDVLKVPFIASWPGRIPAGSRSAALQCLHDLPVSTLRAAGVEPPICMTGTNQLPAWESPGKAVRQRLLAENRHQPNTLMLKTLVTERHKLTLYRGEDYGELFDLREDPGEISNLWDDPEAASLKERLTRELLEAMLDEEAVPMPRVAGA